MQSSSAGNSGGSRIVSSHIAKGMQVCEAKLERGERKCPATAKRRDFQKADQRLSLGLSRLDAASPGEKNFEKGQS